MGCGPMRELPDLGGVVQPKHNLSSSFDGERLKFQCLPGLHGNPIATCTNRKWTLTDTCGHFKTSLGCKCQREWHHCDGWFFTDCKVRYGCGGVDSSNTAWCPVVPGSCPSFSWEP